MFQEVWAAELQIGHLSRLMDHIFIFEATKTFAGRDKFMYFKNYRSQMQCGLGKTTYVEVDDLPDVEQTAYIGSAGRPAPENRWPLERAMRNAARRVIGHLPDDCVVYILDIDEVLAEPVFETVDARIEDKQVIAFSLFDYRASIASSGFVKQPFTGGYAARASTCKRNDIHFMRRFIIKDGKTVPSNFRLALEPHEKHRPIHDFIEPDLNKLVIEEAGWHLSSMHGGYRQYLESKVQNFAHSESWTKPGLVDAREDQYAALKAFVLAQKTRYDYEDIDNNIPGFIRSYAQEFPILLQLNPG
ncbi:hypothetical protein F1654_11305 [Alkalicaulis satelles]|uniref:Glycosyl transferase family 17 n=1 Tax=Alkalicaulis satelles TaxID=2609175 RepID=A0A5M6ZJJ0_9PROT|nr:hypothetical protein [Alkalicaulis satelles]KAA5802401.1 hypothetical protein F1654_11305 [Alkalicaulis satelles]